MRQNKRSERRSGSIGSQSALVWPASQGAKKCERLPSKVPASPDWQGPDEISEIDFAGSEHSALSLLAATRSRRSRRRLNSARLLKTTSDRSPTVRRLGFSSMSRRAVTSLCSLPTAQSCPARDTSFSSKPGLGEVISHSLWQSGWRPGSQTLAGSPSHRAQRIETVPTAHFALRYLRVR